MFGALKKWFKHAREPAKLEKVLNNAYVFNDEFEHNAFPESNVVRVAFRTVGSKKRDHWANRLAARATRFKSDKYPGGFMCHTELIIALRPGVYLKASVIKKTWTGKDADGKDTFKPGCVHLKRTDPREWQTKYIFVNLHAERREIKQMVEFMIQQNGQAFNHKSYYGCLAVPGGLGVKYYDAKLMDEAHAFFCTQFITCALQCLCSISNEDYTANSWRRNIWTVNAATSSPNLLYRVLKSSHGIYDDVALGSTLSIL